MAKETGSKNDKILKALKVVLDDMEDRNDHTGYDVVEAIFMNGLDGSISDTQAQNRIRFWLLRQEQGHLTGKDVAMREELRKAGEY